MQNEEIFKKLEAEITKFHIWKKTALYSLFGGYSYPKWRWIYVAFVNFLKHCPVEEWTLHVIQNVVDIIVWDRSEELIPEIMKDEQRGRQFESVVKSTLLDQIAQLRVYAKQLPTDYNAGLYEYILQFQGWNIIDDLVDVFLCIPLADRWTDDILQGILYLLDVGRLRCHAIRLIAKKEDRLLVVAAAAVTYSDDFTRGLLAAELDEINFKRKEAAEFLLKYMEDKELSVRGSALVTLGRLGFSSHVEQFAEEMWNSGHERARREVLMALEGTRSPLLNDYLVKAKQDGRELLVRWATRIEEGRDLLSEWDEHKLLTKAALALTHPAVFIRAPMAADLGGITLRRRDAEALLLKFMEDSDDCVRSYAIPALGRLASSHVEHLAEREWNRGYKKKDEQQSARMSVLTALSAKNSSHLKEYLMKAKQEPPGSLLIHANRIEKELGGTIA